MEYQFLSISRKAEFMSSLLRLHAKTHTPVFIIPGSCSKLCCGSYKDTLNNDSDVNYICLDFCHTNGIYCKSHKFEQSRFA